MLNDSSFAQVDSKSIDAEVSGAFRQVGEKKLLCREIFAW